MKTGIRTAAQQLSALCTALALLVACGEPGVPEVPASDTIFTGRFVTLDEARPEVAALAVREGVIVAMGSLAEVEAQAGTTARRIAVPGVAVPGWVDAHVHISGYGSLLEMLNVQNLRKQDIVAAVAEQVGQRAPGEWLVGRGWDEGFFDVESYPTRQDLDAVSPDNPVYLERIDGHSGWANSAALALAGVTRGTADPEGGRILKDDAGEPSGMLLETATGLVAAVMPQTGSRDVLERQMRLAFERYVRFGLTGVHDAGTSLVEIDILKDLLAAGELPIRVYAMASGHPAVQHYLDTGPEVGLGDDLLTVRSFKIMMDGALGARGAELSEPYSDAPDTSGLQQMADEQVGAFLANARERGFQVNAHVIGDLGVRRMLDAMERAGVSPDERFRLEHASMIAPGDLPRFAALGAVASLQPVFVGE
ncbi:MAG: amidohydrolase, partial [Gammaproteobacteria bacterium]|nr:amidohydrolase [Gammaproteobacteria bacterium]